MLWVLVLVQVMKECVRDDAERMNEIVLSHQACLTNQTVSDNEGKIVGELEELQDIVEQVDMAQVFVKFHGCTLLLQFLEQDGISEAIRCQAAVTIATLCQNNIIVQQQLYDQQVLRRLANVYLQVGDPTTCTKVHYAISCLVRGHAALETEFCQSYMVPLFSKSLSQQVEASAFSSPSLENLVGKVFFLSAALVTSDSASAGRIEAICQVVLSPAVQHWSTYLQSCAALRDSFLAFVNTIVHTSLGYATLAGSPDRLQALLQSLETYLSSSEGSEDRLAHELRDALQQRQPQVLYPSREVSSQAASESQSETGPEVLLIEPPSLEAAARPP